MAESKKEYKKIQKTSEYNKKGSKHRYIEQIRGYQWGEGRGKRQCKAAEQEVQTIRHNISCKGMLYDTRKKAIIL